MGQKSAPQSFADFFQDQVSALAAAGCTVTETAASIVSPGHDSRAVANRFVDMAAARGRVLTIVDLLKLVYLAHGWVLGSVGRPLIRHPVEAWKYGPVIPRIYKEFRKWGVDVRKLAYNGFGKPYQAEFTKREEEIMDWVYKTYSPLSPKELSDITHEDGGPWAQVKYGGPFAPIPNEIIRDYYAKRVAQGQGV